MNLKGVMQVKNESDKKSDKKDDKSKKALFIQRLIAFLIDSVIVVFAASLLSTPFINSERITDLNNKSIELMEKYKAGKVSNNEDLAEYMNITYDTAKNEGIVSLISVILGLIVFVIIYYCKKKKHKGMLCNYLLFALL